MARWNAFMYHASLTQLSAMTYGILFEKIESGELPQNFYYAYIPALGLTTHGEGIEGARAAA
jgi:hypothetical protein